MEKDREEFNKWFQGEQGKPYDGMYMFALAAWQARQPEIDALNAKLESREAQMETVGSIERDLRNELARLKAENERLRDDAERYRWLREDAWLLLGEKSHLEFDEFIDAAMKEAK